MKEERRRNRTQKQQEVFKKIWEAICSTNEEEIILAYFGGYWEVNGQRIEGDVSLSPSRFTFMIKNSKEIESIKTENSEEGLLVDVTFK